MTVKAVLQFPPGFLWGCATASHQVEGKNTNNWWRWEQTPGRIFQNQRSGDACQWWAGRFAEDFDRAAEMHNNAQRISIEWSRIEPEPDKWDDWAIGRYRDMLQALHARGMKPMITLHHFTHPLWIEDQQGWLWDETPTRFARFVRKAVEQLGDLCTLWCTINEPNVYAILGHMFGVWPPGLKSMGAVSRVTGNMLRGHALAYHAIKEAQPHSQVGLALHYTGIRPEKPAFIHGLAARMVDSFFNMGVLTALQTGTLRLPGARRIAVPSARGTLDWIGLQYYQEFRARLDPRAIGSLFVTYGKPKDMPVGPHTWGGINPSAIGGIIKRLWVLLQKPIYITESGVPDPEDAIRPGYMVDTLKAVWQAVGFNFPVLGFFHWSLVDNFEWAEGYDPRYSFGLYAVDFATQQRTARPSAALYRDICAQNGLSAEIVAQHVPGKLAQHFPGEAGKNNVKLKERKA